MKLIIKILKITKRENIRWTSTSISPSPYPANSQLLLECPVWGPQGLCPRKNPRGPPCSALLNLQTHPNTLGKSRYWGKAIGTDPLESISILLSTVRLWSIWRQMNHIQRHSRNFNRNSRCTNRTGNAFSAHLSILLQDKPVLTLKQGKQKSIITFRRLKQTMI